MRRPQAASAAVAALLLPLAFAGCSRKETPAPEAGAMAPAPALPATAATTPAGPCALNLFIWSEYIDPEIVAAFEKENACKVTIDLYEDNESMMAKLQGGGTSLYDLVVPSQYLIPVLAKLDLLAELRHENIPNLANLDEKFVDPVYDPGNKHSVAYQWGTVGIYLRKKPGKTIDETWGLLFDKSKQYGSFLLMDSVREMFGSLAKYQGKGVNTTNPDEVRALIAALSESKGRSQGIEGGVGGKNKVLAKAVTAAVVYNGDAVRGMADDAETTYFVPREGGVLWVDNLVVPARAPHRDTAEKFINYILDARVGAQLSNFNQYATPNRAAKAFITPEDLANVAIYPSAEMMAKLEFVNDLGEGNQLYDEAWTQVKSK
jgi:spermidine/putrescine transport system substrate-binding protein